MSGVAAMRAGRRSLVLVLVLLGLL
ncbi:hypothetical protein MNBD_ALPHA06-1780, partial [hydrothermal vent metagenome]